MLRRLFETTSMARSKRYQPSGSMVTAILLLALAVM
jgi:hypothetical protein